MSRTFSPSLIAGLHALAGTAALTFALFLATPANAQALTKAFGGLSESSNEPIDIEADGLVVHDKDRYATFKGNVKAVQGSTTLRANELNVHVGGEKPASGAGKQASSQSGATQPSDAKENSAGGDDDAQTGKMIGISEDPMDIESDVLVVHDKDKYATFRGNVKAVQGTSTLNAAELTVSYTGGDKLASASKTEGGEPATATKAFLAEGPAGGRNAQITKIEAKGNVVIINKKDSGNNVLEGERLVIDLVKDQAWVESAGDAASGSRVRAVFVSEDATGANSADAKPGETESQPNSAAANPGEAKSPEAVTGNTAGSESDGVTARSEVSGADGDRTNSQGNVTKIEAKGNVVITSEDNQTTTSDWALYDVKSQMVTVGGNVVLTQGKNVLNGDRLLIDLRTGESRFEHTGGATAGGRIRGLFMPKGGGKSKDTKPADAKDAVSPKKAAPGGGEAEDALTAGEPDDVPLLLKPQL